MPKIFADPEAIAEDVHRLRTSGGVAIAFSVCGERRPLPAAATLALLRTAREAARNAVRTLRTVTGRTADREPASA